MGLRNYWKRNYLFKKRMGIMKPITFFLMLLPAVLFGQKNMTYTITPHDGVLDVAIADTLGPNRFTLETIVNLDTADIQNFVYTEAMAVYDGQADDLVAAKEAEIRVKKMRGALAGINSDDYLTWIKAWLNTTLDGSYTYVEYSFLGGASNITTSLSVNLSGWEIRNVGNNNLLATVQPLSSRLLEITINGSGEVIQMAQTAGNFIGSNANGNVIMLIR